jgi:hypothetical protein
MPPISTITKFLGSFNNPYKRTIGKHTRKFNLRAIQKAKNESQKKLWLSASIAAEELVAALLKLDSKVNLEQINQNILKIDIDKKQVLTVLRAYLSAVVVLISTYKETILASTALTEKSFLQAWCSVFEYQPADMKVFDEVLLTAYSQSGTNGLIEEIGKIIADNFYQETTELIPEDMTVLEGILLNDVSGILQYLKQPSE